MFSSEPESRPGIIDSIKCYIKLLLEDTRLSVAEKLTRLLSGLALSVVLMIIATVALVFISIGISMLLARTLSPMWAFLIVAGFYVVLFAVVILCRRFFIVDPIARFISRLIINPPVNPATQNHDNQSASVS